MENLFTNVRVVLVGDSAVGKTSIARRLADDIFKEDESSTIGANYFTKNYKFDGQTVELQVWDTAGQEVYQSLTPMYYRGSIAAVFVFDTTSLISFQNIGNKWLEQLHTAAGDETILFLVENKVDLSEASCVKRSDIENFARENCFTYYRVSAKTGESIQELFQDVATKSLAEVERRKRESENVESLGIQLQDNNKTSMCSC